MKRSEAIRKMCRLGGVRVGATDSEIRGLYGEYVDVLMDKDVDAALVVREALELLPPTRSADAIKNALINEDQSTLGQRRERFMAAHDLSLRTVVRDEDDGAELLAGYIEKAPAYLASSNLTARNLASFSAMVVEEEWRLTEQIAEKRGVPVEQILSERISRIATLAGVTELEYLFNEAKGSD